MSRPRSRAWLPCAALVLFLQDPVNLLANGAIEGPRGWSSTDNTGGGRADFRVDREVGASAKGSLCITNEDAADRQPHNWRQMVDLPGKDKPGRLKLWGQVRLESTGPGSEACLIANLYDSKGNMAGHVRCPEIRQDTSWKRIETIFDVPEGIVQVHVMAYFVGGGTAWFDDLGLARTDEPVTRASAVPASSSRYEDLVRGCAADLPWVFGAEPALARARAEGKPILCYVRCTDDREHFESMRTSIRAEDVRFQEDGHAKDVLFRAGPLSEPEVRGLICRRFVPVCLSYILGDNTYGADLPPDWETTGERDGLLFEGSALEGHARPGSLSIRNGDAKDRDPHNWTQAFDPRSALELPAELELSASVKTAGFASGSEATVMIQCWKGQEMLNTGRLPETFQDRPWTRKSARFTVPEGTDSVRVRAYLVGSGQVWFDDLELRPAKESDQSLLRNGGLDRISSAELGGFAISPRELTTPALVALDPSGRVVRKLHRFGALSSDLVDRWLRGVLAEMSVSSGASEARELLLDGELERVLAATEDARGEGERVLRARALVRQGELAAARAVLDGLASPEASLVRALVELRGGEWARARQALGKAVDAPEPDVREEARFWDAWCLERLGEFAAARKQWTELAGESLFGRRAAACVLDGPRLSFGLSVREWPRTSELPEATELGGPFDAQETVTALLEMQRADGSFGSHMGPDGLGPTDPAITALAADALRTWQPKVAATLRKPVEAARSRALSFLARWSQAPPPGSDAFNNAYALMTLAAEGEREAAGRLIARIAGSQLPDGNWTVYGPQRPASFNTALSCLALLRAKQARLEIDKKVLQRGIDALEHMRQEGGLFPYSTAQGHEWMTTPHGSIARDPLCEHVLLLAGKGSKEKLAAALERYCAHAHELRLPTKRLYDYFNSRGHGGYYFFFAHENAVEAATAFAGAKDGKRTLAVAREAVLAAREGDGTFVDAFLLGRAYGTAMALLILGR